MIMLIRGSCHCGNVTFDLDWEGEPREIPARACGCSSCVKHGGVWTSSPKAKLEVSIRDDSLLDARLARRTRSWIADVRFRRAST